VREYIVPTLDARRSGFFGVAGRERTPLEDLESKIAEFSRSRSRFTDVSSSNGSDDIGRDLQSVVDKLKDRLAANSPEYKALVVINGAGLRDCTRCVRELETRLAGNPSYVLLKKLEELHGLSQQVSSRLASSRS
jgi:hypothetical protein